MSLVLHELLLCCRGLENDKATERKKEVDRLRRLIRSRETVEELDRTSGVKASKGSKQLTWDAVFRFLQKYLQKETELLQSGKANVSAITQANRQKKMQEISSLIKDFIRRANKRGPKLKCAELLSHVVEVLKGSFTCSAYGEDYSSILLKDVLSVRKYWCEITQTQWHSLLNTYCGLFNEASKSINRVLVSRIIHVVIQGCCLQTEGLSHTLFTFFSNALSKARTEKQLTVLEHLLSALNVFLRSAATNRRQRACHLGEEVLPSILCVWSQKRPSPTLKEEMVEFFRLQVCIHHPKGAKTPETGAHAEDWTKWQGQLFNLYEALVDEISQLGSRGKYATGCRHIAVKDNLIDLTADLCHQLFSLDMRPLEAAPGHYRGTQLDSPQGSKRRRVELGWEVLRDHLQPHLSDFDMIPWLQVTATLTCRYPSILPGSELIPLLALLCQLLGEQQRRGERGPYVLRCLKEVARCQAEGSGYTQEQLTELGRLWSRVWVLAVRGVSSAQTETLSLELLHAMVQGNLVHVDREFWKLFSGSVCKPSLVSALSLAQALSKFPVPKTLFPRGHPSTELTENRTPPSLREAVIGWLLSTEQNEEGEENSRPHFITRRDFPQNLIPRILVTLTLKDSRAGMEFLMDAYNPESLSPQTQQAFTDSKTSLGEIEQLYLQFSFDELGTCSTERPNTCSLRPEESPQLTVIQSLRNILEQSLLSVADQLLNCYSPESQLTPPQCLVRCVRLLTGVLGAYVCVGLLTEDEAAHCPLFQKAKKLAQDFGEYVSTAKNKLTEDEGLCTLKSVMLLCAESISRTDKDKVSTAAGNLFMKALPARLPTDLAEICKIMLTNSSRRDNVIPDDDQMEEDLEVTRTQVANQGEVDLFDDGDVPRCSTNGTQQSNTDTGDTQCGSGAKSVLSEELLGKQDQAFLAALEFLCLCASSQLLHGLSFKTTDIRRKLLKLLDQVEFAKPLHLHTYLVLLKNLPAEGAVLGSEEFDCLLRPLADLCSMYRQDQEVCAAVLMNLLPSVRCLGHARGHSEGGDNDDMGHVRGALLKVVSGFRFLANTGKCISSVKRALGHCLQAFLEADPRCEWAVLTEQEEELPVSVVLPSLLADSHHHVRMLAALAVDRLFLDKSANGAEKKMLPLKQQQTAFENVYLKAQEGMTVPKNMANEDLPDETFNRRATLLKSVSMVMCCSPVCEKQALFALFQSYKENSIEEKLIKKVLCSVSRSLGYHSSESLISSRLYYLVAEWLGQRQTDPSYTLESFPYTLLNYATLEEFYRSSYHVLIPHLVFLNDFEQVRSIGAHLGRDWRQLLADCFPKIMVNILPHFAMSGQDSQAGRQREKAHRVYDLLKDSECLGKQQIDNLICNNLADIVVELLMTLYEEAEPGTESSGELQRFTGELDPAPNPPFFSSYVIKATLDYLSKCHSASHKTLVAILSKTPISIQKILVAVCQRAAETANSYERHRILMMYHLFVGLLLCEVKDGLGGAWAFVLRDIIYSLIHHINSRPARLDEVSTRSLSLCCDLLTSVCRTAVQYCDDALESHLQVIVGTLTAQVTDQSPISKQVLGLLKFLVMENPENGFLRRAIPLLEPFPDQPAFRELRAAQHALKYSTRALTLRQEIEHFLSVTSCDSLPLTRLEGLKDLKKRLHVHKQQIGELLKECHADPGSSVLVRLVLNLLQLCKLAVNHPGGKDILEAVGSCLGELGPVNLSTIALHHGKDEVYTKAAALHSDPPVQWIYIILSCMNNALTHHNIAVRQAAAQCLRDILATQSGVEFWEMYKAERDPMLVYLSPFRSVRKKEQAVRAECTAESRRRLERSEVWIPLPGQHKAWLRNLCVTLLESGGVQHEALLLTKPLCQVRTGFCQRMLPLFIHAMLLGDRAGYWREVLSTHIQGFFSHYCKPNSSSSSSSSGRPTTPVTADSGDSDVATPGHVDKFSLRTMLAVVDYLRQQRRPLEPGGQSFGTICDSNFWLDLNYVEVARAAQLCSAHFTALLYTEIYVDKIRSNREEGRRTQSKVSRRITFDESSQSLSIGSMTEKSMEDTGISLQDLLIEVYSSIGEPDSLYGCGGGKMVSPLTRIRTYEHEALWGKALTSYDLYSNLPEVTRQVGIVEALQNFGLSSVLSVYLQGLQSEGVEWSPELRELRFQAAWRNTQWHCDLPERTEKLSPGFNESVFIALQALKDKEFSTFDQTLKYARVAEVEELCRGSLEAVSSLYPALCNLQRISELESVRELFSRPVTDSSLAEVFTQWQQHSGLLEDSDFSLVEPALALRTALLDTLLTCQTHTPPDSKNNLGSNLSTHLIELCRLARSARNTQLAERAVFQLKQHSAASEGSVTSLAWQLEEAQVFWVKKEQELALELLRHVTDNLEASVDLNPAAVPVYTECLRLCGSWLAETCLESPAVILEKYLERAVEVIEDHSDSKDARLQSQRTQAFLSLARFSDAQYQSIENYMKSSEFENKQALLEKAKEEVELMKERRVSSNRYTVKVQRELELDVKALANLQSDRRRFLLKAVENYITCLELGEEHDTWVFRLASLWLENADVKDVNDKMRKGVKRIPSHKFLPLMYQLAARMGTKVSVSEDVGFHDVLYELIYRSSLDHPHHTLFIILALVNANKDENFSRSRLSKAAARQPSPLDLERAEVARKIINVVRKQKAQMIRGLETLCEAYITLAYMDASRYKTEKKAIPIPADQPIMKIKDLDDVIIPTMEIKVDPSGQYENLVTLRSFEPHFRLAGGVNLPKIIDCVGSDGKSRRQLVKGQDDLRQDAVMQQVFQMCSMLLQRNAETRRRKLNIRRYKVVPFSQRSGVLEWCTGTVPIGEFLVDPQKGAHKRYRPQDWTNLACRRKMMESQAHGFDGKYQAFMEVCQNFRPVFRYFCMERFLDPAVWLEKRLAYTRSVATSSIVGYIVGLGDRHIQNILIDEQTAELVHIDLGVAFEQGKILPTPETVPFRLSRDIVDGMGITGVEGVFRRCCEKTMEVMRSSQEALLTIVEVLLYDPLFDWTMNPLKAFYLQQQDEQAELNATLNPTPGGEELEAHRRSSDSQSFNKVAERVLLRLQEKLKGVEEGAVLSVGGQVNLLIQQAMDPKNLSRLFPGWQAWV
ncbi:serine-protein kinase ATM isoform X2 [Chanos chanos]|uniref:non-specific serine/threonine protein kinase n=1 Tax=Chanos chanos TaxID=29144 RepID=A0A6J2VLV4_CHACN|nr:serine-protein kinase ATM isoform X2 [Chanos chanos]